jgi:hypothetical protein
MQTTGVLARDDVLDGDLIIGHYDAFHDQSQNFLLHLEGWLGQLRLNPRAASGHRLLQGCGLLRLHHLPPDNLRPLLQPMLRLTEALSADPQLVQLEDAHLVRVQQPLLLVGERRALARDPLQLPLGIGERRALAVLLFAQVCEDQRRPTQEPPQMLPDYGLDVALADRPQPAAARGRLATPAPRALVAPAGSASMPAQPAAAVPTD